MAKFQRKGKGGMPAISTSSLPDIVFMLLFFFMVSTVMRETSLKIDVTVPAATEIIKLEKKSLVSYIYVGAPMNQFQSKYGTEPRIQLNDQFAQVGDVIQFIISEREAQDEAVVPLMTTSLKVDGKTEMGIVTDIKQELRKCSALKINYSTRKKEK
ncbi:MAG: biopolymer transporter ExbD [Bacteroidota bacterium]|nr:biopolymer transporter ExbD [Bacteroidota bacterium]